MVHQTQCEKVVAMMIRDNNPGRWWHAWEYMGNVHDLFVGHRAPARISDLGRSYPQMIETQRDPDKPRLHMYRFRFENYDEFIKILPDDLKQTVIREMIRVDRITGDSFIHS